MTRTQRRDMLISLAPLVLAVTFAFIAWIVLHAVSEGTKNRWVDPWIVGAICVTYALASGTMLAKTRLGPWSPLGAGLLLTIIADASLYFYLLAVAHEWSTWYDVTLTEITRYATPTETTIIVAVSTTSPLVDIVRSLLVAGGPFLAWGALREWDTRRGGQAT